MKKSMIGSPNLMKDAKFGENGQREVNWSNLKSHLNSPMSATVLHETNDKREDSAEIITISKA